jgi:hypothetical protein
VAVQSLKFWWDFKFSNAILWTCAMLGTYITGGIGQCFATEHWRKVVERETKFPQCSVPGQPQKIRKENGQKIMKITIYGAFYHVLTPKNECFLYILYTIVL